MLSGRCSIVSTLGIRKNDFMVVHIPNEENYVIIKFEKKQRRKKARLFSFIVKM